MTGLLYLIPVALCLGLLGLAAFLWSLRSGQFDDPQGAAERILHDEPDGEPEPRSEAMPRAEAESGERSPPPRQSP